MSARHLVLSLFAALTLGLWAAAHAAESAADRPNIVLIVADDLSRRQCTFLPEEHDGGTIMPTLERLAVEGTVLRSLRSPSPICTPSRFALLSGRYPSRSRHEWFLREAEEAGQTVVQFNTFLIEGDTTLPGLLKRAG
ncbi:MAG: sulfatase-like hydrolase/transferase, partial [Planctomycetes bacterium]|nr:sulfatase-like hydrolase/transferase [Planctomycetota bacterium]